MKLYKFILLMLICPFTFAGTVDGGGAGLSGLNNHNGSAWFINSNSSESNHLESVSYCIENESANISNNTVNKVFNIALNRWFQYFEKRNLNQNLASSSFAIKYILDYQKVDCSPLTNLKILVASSKRLVEKYPKLKNNLQEPLITHAFSFRDEERKGVMWINSQSFSDDFYNYENLELLITHEVGHIMGFTHIANTIMDYVTISFFIISEGVNRDDLKEFRDQFLVIKKRLLRDFEYGSFLMDFSSLNMEEKNVSARVAKFGTGDFVIDSQAFHKIFNKNLSSEKVISKLFIQDDILHAKEAKLIIINSQEKIELKINISSNSFISGLGSFSNPYAVKYSVYLDKNEVKPVEDKKMKFSFGVPFPDLIIFPATAIYRNKKIPINIFVNSVKLNQRKGLGYFIQRIPLSPISINVNLDGKLFPLFGEFIEIKQGNAN